MPADKFKSEQGGDELEVAELQVEVAVLRAENTRFKEQLEAVQAERDSLRATLADGVRIDQRTELIAAAAEMTRDGVGVTQLTEHGPVIHVNQALRDMLELKEGEDIVDPENFYCDPEQAREVFKTIRAGYTWDGELCMRTSRGLEIDVELRADPVYNTQGEIIGLVGIHRDVTERNLRQRQLEMYGDLIEQAPFGVYMVDPQGNYTLVNKQAEEQTGYSHQELLAMNISDLIPPEEREEALAGFEELKANGRQEMEINFARQDGTRRPMLLSGVHHDDMLFAFCADLTDIKELQAQVSQAERQAAISKLSGGIAHNFNNALAALMGKIDLLLMGMENQNDASLDRYARELNKIQQTAFKMAEWVEKLMYYAGHKIEQPEPINLSEYLQSDLSTIVTSLGHSAQVEVEATNSVDNQIIYFDRGSLDTIVSGLLENAVKASIPNGQVEVDFTATEENLRITIVDHGRGMSEEELQFLGEPYHTFDIRGGGLTVSSIMGIVKKAGGSINYESEPGQGTTVRVELPLRKKS